MNIIAVRAGDEQRADLQQLVEALLTDEIRQFALDQYQGAVVPAF